MPAGCAGIHALKRSAVAILNVIFNSIYKDATATDRTAAEGNEVKMPPTTGAAIRFHTSDPVPVAHMMGTNPTNIVGHELWTQLLIYLARVMTQ